MVGCCHWKPPICNRSLQNSLMTGIMQQPHDLTRHQLDSTVYITLKCNDILIILQMYIHMSYLHTLCLTRIEVRMIVNFITRI